MFFAVRWASLIGLAALMACGTGIAAGMGTGTSVPPCQTSQLHGSFRNPDAAAGQRYVQLVLTNTGNAPCSVSAYPTLELVGGDGRALPTKVVRIDAGSTRRLTVRPGRRISSVLHWAGIPLADEAQTGPCEPMPSLLNIIPPGEVTALSVRWSLDPVCGHGEIDAKPFRPGVPSP